MLFIPWRTQSFYSAFLTKGSLSASIFYQKAEKIQCKKWSYVSITSLAPISYKEFGLGSGFSLKVSNKLIKIWTTPSQRIDLMYSGVDLFDSESIASLISFKYFTESINGFTFLVLN